MQPSKTTQDARRYVCERLRHLGVELFCSPLLIDQLTEQSQALGSFAMVDLIQLIQRHRETDFFAWPRGPRKPDQFERPPLKGLWKAHMVPQGLGDFTHNLHREADQKWFEKKLDKLFADNASGDFDKNLAGKVAHLAVTQGIANRGMRNSLTSGHWLIFSETPFGAFYLCSAHHEEDDRLIFDRVRKAAEVFPNAAFSFGPPS
ncbi:hypothetical protein T7987_03270 [Sulfitobacter faviae]|uniref:Uncharacterized protein n=1 Tax=Sulfitobacter faviae TaxID=1775881 RepID=A0ABZ0V2Z4_9RHOB|nr:hypothetical protein [Sulfitobacter faviae]WPZ22272.1 hypothetical protein T7987_03270 [Sulfitobacter faviae]